METERDGNLDVNKKNEQLTLLSSAAAPRSRSKSSTQPASGPGGDGFYQLKVTLKGVRPPIWRRFRVPGKISLARLHLVLLTVMGWQGGHLYEFQIGQRRIGEPAPRSLMADFYGEKTEDANRIELRRVAPREGARLVYVYDFGDDWQHQIVVEKTTCPEADADRIVCLDGRRACPPEDCGGVWGYADLTADLAEPAGADSPERLRWLEEVHGRHDPEHFDPVEVTRRLANFNPVGRNQSTRRR